MEKIDRWNKGYEIPEGSAELFTADGFDYLLVVAECECSRWQVTLPPKSDGRFGRCGYCKQEVRRA